MAYSWLHKMNRLGNCLCLVATSDKGESKSSIHAPFSSGDAGNSPDVTFRRTTETINIRNSDLDETGTKSGDSRKLVVSKNIEMSSFELSFRTCFVETSGNGCYDLFWPFAVIGLLCCLYYISHNSWFKRFPKVLSCFPKTSLISPSESHPEHCTLFWAIKLIPARWQQWQFRRLGASLAAVGRSGFQEVGGQPSRLGWLGPLAFNCFTSVFL